MRGEGTVAFEVSNPEPSAGLGTDGGWSQDNTW